MAWSFSRKLSNSSLVKKNGSKTWTSELLDTLLVYIYLEILITTRMICNDDGNNSDDDDNNNSNKKCGS